jgi:hypothetical protein
VRRGLKGAQRKSAGRWTRTGYKVWYNPDELARDSEVLYLPQGLCFINPASTRRKSRHLPRETCIPCAQALGDGRPKPTGLQESAEGVVGGRRQS